MNSNNALIKTLAKKKQNSNSAQAQAKRNSTNNIYQRIYALSYIFVFLFGGIVVFNKEKRTAKKMNSYYPISKIVSPNGDPIFDENDCKKEQSKARTCTDIIKRISLNRLITELEQYGVVFDKKKTKSARREELTIYDIRSFIFTRYQKILPPEFTDEVNMKKFQPIIGESMLKEFKEYQNNIEQICLCSSRNILPIPGIDERSLLIVESLSFDLDQTTISITTSSESELVHSEGNLFDETGLNSNSSKKNSHDIPSIPKCNSPFNKKMVLTPLNSTFNVTPYVSPLIEELPMVCCEKPNFFQQFNNEEIGGFWFGYDSEETKYNEDIQPVEGFTQSTFQ